MIQVNESIVEQLSGKEDESETDNREEEPEQPIKKVGQVPGKIVVRPGIRRTSRRSAAGRRMDEDEEEENNDEQMENTSKDQNMEEVNEKIITLQFVVCIFLSSLLPTFRRMWEGNVFTPICLFTVGVWGTLAK